MSDELKPCPFCGGAAIRTPLYLSSSVPVRIACENIGCAVNPSTLAVHPSSERDIGAAWNARAAPKVKAAYNDLRAAIRAGDFEKANEALDR